MFFITFSPFFVLEDFEDFIKQVKQTMEHQNQSDHLPYAHHLLYWASIDQTSHHILIAVGSRQCSPSDILGVHKTKQQEQKIHVTVPSAVVPNEIFPVIAKCKWLLLVASFFFDVGLFIKNKHATYPTDRRTDGPTIHYIR